MARVPDEKHNELENTRKEIHEPEELFGKAGMETVDVTMLERAMTFSEARTLRRFPLEYLSLRNPLHDPLPPEYK